MREPGERVGAILSANSEVFELLGYGVYDGEHPCPLLEGHLNPRITLDDGTVIWGCQCWWGSEESFKRKEQEYRDHSKKVIVVDVFGNEKQQGDEVASPKRCSQCGHPLRDCHGEDYCPNCNLPD